MIITTIDLSKPRKFIKYHSDNILLDLRMRNVDVDRYLSIGLNVSIILVMSLFIQHTQPHDCNLTPKQIPTQIYRMFKSGMALEV